MSLIVEDGTIVSGANTYASLEAVTAYHAARGHTSWLPASDDAGPAILRAMDWLESKDFNGTSIFQPGIPGGQPLKWPRSNVILDGYEWNYSMIPPRLIKALCEAALIELETPGALAPALERGGMVQSESVDVISTTYAAGAPAGTVYTALNAHLRGLVGIGGGGSVRLTRG